MSLLDSLLLDPQKLDVWIALRTDGVKGSGTETDPWNGSPRYEASFSVSSLTRSGREATATTASNHGYANGDVVTISGVTGTEAPFYNGSFVIYDATTNPNTFKYWMKADPGGSGSGTMSCARTFYQLDEVMATLGANTAIHLGPGVFLTRGYRSGDLNLRIHSGQTIRGAGMYVTTVKLVNAAVADSVYAVIGTLATGAELESFEVSDLTVDCNLDGQLIAGQEFPLIAGQGIMASGAYLLYRRVRAINFGTLKYPYECFVLWSAGSHPDATVESVDCVIEDCIVEQPAINQAHLTTCIIMGGGENAAGLSSYHRGCVVRNCLIDCEFKFSPVAISQIAFSGSTTATVTTRAPHGRAVNDWVRISGALVSGSLDNPYNGSFKITAVTPPDQFQYTMTSTPSAQPVGDMWVDRFSSHLVPNAQVSKTAGPESNYTVTITTETPHFRVPGNNVLVNEVYVGTAQNPVLSPIYNGSFKVEDDASWDPKKLKYVVTSDPGQSPALYPGFIGPFFQGISNDGGTAAVVEGNRVLNTRIGGPYHDFYSTKTLIVRNNYYRSVVTGPYQALGKESLPTPAAPLTPISHIGLIATFTINSTKPHGFTVGQGVRILGAKIDGADPPTGSYNGVYKVESVDTTSFTYKMVNDPGPSPSADPGTGTVSALWQVQQCVMENNVIELIPSFMGWGPPFGILLVAAPANDMKAFRIFRRVVIRNNVIRYVDNLTEQTVRNIAIDLGYCEDALVENNVVDLAIADPIRHSNSNSVKYFQNTNPAGQLIQGRLVPPTGPSVMQDELTTFIEDATTLCIL